MYRAVDPALVAEAVRQWTAGEGTIREVARRTGVSTSTISRWAKRTGFERKKAPAACAECDEAGHDRRNCPGRTARSTGSHFAEARADG